MQIFDEGSLIPIDFVTEAIIRAVLDLRGEITNQQYGMALLHFSPQDIDLSVWRKNTAATTHKKVERRGTPRS